MISAKFFRGNVLLGGKQQIDAKIPFWNCWECPLYEISEYIVKIKDKLLLITGHCEIQWHGKQCVNVLVCASDRKISDSCMWQTLHSHCKNIQYEKTLNKVQLFEVNHFECCYSQELQSIIIFISKWICFVNI